MTQLKFERVLAFDGGATETRAGLYDSDRKLIAEETGRPTNPAEIGEAACVEVLVELGSGLLQERQGVSCLVCAGIAGARGAALRARLARGLSNGLEVECACVSDDVWPILLANSEGSDTVLAVSGTGSVVLAQSRDGRNVRVGGRGPILGDQGSAYRIAIDGLRSATHAVDSNSGKTGLVTAFIDAVGVQQFEELAAWTTSASKGDIAALAKTVVACAEEGDESALNAVKHHAGALAEQARLAMKQLKLPDATQVIRYGGMFEHSALYRDTFENALHDGTAKPSIITPELRGHHAVMEFAFGIDRMSQDPDVVAIERR